jgi:hypothetical protein
MIVGAQRIRLSSLTCFYDCSFRQRLERVECYLLRGHIRILREGNYTEGSAAQYVLQLELGAVENHFLEGY